MILITGGAGYIGAHVNKYLNQRGYETITVDNLCRGHKEAVKWGNFVECDLADYDKLKKVFQNYDIDAVMHFAAFALVSESNENPELYFKNNYENTLNLLKVMKEENIDKIIFSSTCTLYGNTKKIPITEKNQLNPINPYGQSKLKVEEELKKESDKGNLKYVSLRYFNAAGADEDCEIGEVHDPETHLIPLILDAAIGKRDSVTIFGTDYNTPDGTCVRDYIHVTDLAQAHLKSLEYLIKYEKSNIFNLGNGDGASVMEVIDACKEITGINFKVEIGQRRKGDPDILVANPQKAYDILGWKPEFSDLNKIVETAWNWHKKINI